MCECNVQGVHAGTCPSTTSIRNRDAEPDKSVLKTAQVLSRQSLSMATCHKVFSCSQFFVFVPFLLVSYSESLGNPLSVALPLPLSSSEPVYHSSTVALASLTPSLGTATSTSPPSSSSTTSTTSSSAPSSSHFSSVGGSYDGTVPPHTRLAFSQSKEAMGPVMVSEIHFKGKFSSCV